MNKENKIITNRIYKDRLFCSIFGKEENKKYLLELYNALNHSNYTNIDDIEFTTIENVIYITMKNDVSFLIGNELNLYEQQSTFNPNMLLRGLMYFAQLYQMYIDKMDLDLYSSSLIKIPTPKLIIFYNGNKKIDDTITLKLSDMFIKPCEKGAFEWTANLINLNTNHNLNLLNSCKSLYNYSKYVSIIKENLAKGIKKEEAIDIALSYAIKNNFLDGFFKKQKMEVLNMSLTEFDQEAYDRHRKIDANLETAKNFIRMNVLTIEQIAEGTGLSLETIKELQKNND